MLQVARLTTGAKGKAVKIGRGRAAVTGDDRRKGHCPDMDTGWEGAAGGQWVSDLFQGRMPQPEARKPACDQPGLAFASQSANGVGRKFF